MRSRVTITVIPIDGWSAVKAASPHGLDQLLAQFIQFCPLKVCKECGEELVTADFYKKRRGFDGSCKSCISKIKAKRYKRKKVNQAQAQKRIIQLKDPDVLEVSETFVDENISETARAALSNLIIDALVAASIPVEGGIR